MLNDAEPVSEGRSPFGHLLREFRIAAGLSQEALAERAALSSGGISVLERGARQAPHRDTLALLASALHLSADDRGRFEAAAARVPVPRQRELRATRNETRGRHNLPLSLTSFHGRTDECNALQVSLCEARLVTLTGMGGVGKTRLALETARAVIGLFPDGVWCVELAPVVDPALVAQRVAATLGVAARYEGAPFDTAWIAKLIGRHLLLVLDNCEHVLDAVSAVTQNILERCPDVRVLATSREALRVGGEHVVRVDPLALPALHSGRAAALADLRASSAVTLFLERARLVAPTLKLGEDVVAWQTVANICARLDRLPLAIELAAGRMSAMTLETLWRALDGRFAVLTNGVRTALPRHRTLHALIDWSYGLLREAERRVLRRLAVFSGGWTLESAQAVCPEDGASAPELLAILASLVDKSLIVADRADAGLRYSVLETVRAYALARLTDEGERQPTARRHAEYFENLVRRNNARWGAVPIKAWIAPLDRDLDNLRAALQWSLVEHHDVAGGAAMAAGQSRILELLSLSQEGRRWCERALTALGSNPTAALEASLYLALAKFHVHEGSFEPALEAATRSATLYGALPEQPQREAGTLTFCALSLGYAGCALAGLRRYETAASTASEALAIARRQSDHGVLAWALIVQSWCVGDIAARRDFTAQALVVARSMPAGYSFEGLALAARGLAEFDAGDVEAAWRCAVAAADTLRSSGLHKDVICWALSIAAACAFLKGDFDGAVVCARDGLSLSDGGTWLGPTVNLVGVIAGALAARGNTADAARLTAACEVHYADNATPCDNYVKAVHDRTLALLRESSNSVQFEVWRAEGRTWTYEESIAAALEFERRSEASGSESYG